MNQLPKTRTYMGFCGSSQWAQQNQDDNKKIKSLRHAIAYTTVVACDAVSVGIVHTIGRTGLCLSTDLSSSIVTSPCSNIFHSYCVVIGHDKTTLYATVVPAECTIAALQGLAVIGAYVCTSLNVLDSCPQWQKILIELRSCVL